MEIFGFDVPIWLVLVVGILVIYYRYMTSTFDAFKKTVGVRGPKPWPVIGTCAGMFSGGLLHYDRNMIRKHGKLVATWFGRLPSLIIADVDILHEVLIKQFHNFNNRTVIPLAPPVDRVISLIKDDDWRKVRQTVSPTFSAKKLRRMNEPINECAVILTNNIKAMADSQRPVDVVSSLGGFSMDVIARTAFGVNIDSQSDPNNPFVKMADKALKSGLLSFATFIGLIFPFLSEFLPKVGISFVPPDTISFFVKIVRKAMAQCTNDEDDSLSRTDFLQLMMTAHLDDDESDELSHGQVETKNKKKLTENEILSQGFVFFLVGYDTVANVGIFTLFELARNPNVQETLAAEVKTHLKNEEKPTYDSVQKMKYLDMVVSESLRMYTPVSRVDRMTNEDTTIKGVFIPKGAQVVIPIDYLHHDPDVYPNPYKFDPERFSDEAKADRSPVCYQPFGLGPRNCVAMRLGLLEVKMVIVNILQGFKVSTCPETHIPIKRIKMTGRPEDVKLRFSVREN